MRALPSTTRTATCEACGSVHDVAVPTPGFHCESCIVAEADAKAQRTRHRALALFAVGAILIAIAALIWSAGFDPWYTRSPRSGMPMAVWLGIAGVGVIGVGAGMLRYRPRLKLD